MKYFVALMMALAGTLVPGVAAQAGSRISLATPSADHDGRSSVVSGQVNGRAKSVRIQQRKSGRWVVIRKAAVRGGTYKVRTKAPARAKIRVSTRGKVSRVVRVRPTKPPKWAWPTGPTQPIAPVNPPVAATDACGTVLKKADGTAWSCTLNDDFNGTSLNRSVWMPQTQFAMGTQGAHTCYRDDPSTINVSGGTLNLSMRKVAVPVTCNFGGLTSPTPYISGGVMSYRMFSQQYGRFEARIKNTATQFPGLHEAFWLWPDDRVASDQVWPFAGEIDISETYSSYPNLSIPFLHYQADVYGNIPTVNTAWNCAAPRGVFNTYALEWGPSKIQIFVNGKHCLTNTSGDSAFMKPYIMALTQGMGAAGNVYDGRAPLGTMNVDYVKVWK